MNVGVFLCLEPYTSLENNLRLAHEYGFNYADITDTHSGGSMFASAGLSASVSLDDNPFEVRRTFERNGMKIMTLSAHALLLEPSSPANFATSQIMKAIKFAAGAGIEYVITTETFAKSEWAKSLPVTKEEILRACRYAVHGFDDAEPARPEQGNPAHRADTSAAARNLANLEERLAQACAKLHATPAELGTETLSRLDRICEAAAVELGREMKPDESQLRADYDLTLREIVLRLRAEKEANGKAAQEEPRGVKAQ